MTHTERRQVYIYTERAHTEQDSRLTLSFRWPNTVLCACMRACVCACVCVCVCV